jgi:hypothetical protein
MYRPFVLKLESLVSEMVEKQDLIHHKLERLAEILFDMCKEKL